jgi:hypothetical protein
MPDLDGKPEIPDEGYKRTLTALIKVAGAVKVKG